MAKGFLFGREDSKTGPVAMVLFARHDFEPGGRAQGLRVGVRKTEAGGSELIKSRRFVV